MSSSSDLEWQKREISALVDDVNAIERSLALPKLEGFDDFDRLEALDIVNRIGRKMLARVAEAEVVK
jgi:hypothetical protein